MSGIGEKSIEFLRAIAIGILLLICLVLLPWITKTSVIPPAVSAPATNTSVPQTQAMAVPTSVHVVVIDQHGKPFEPSNAVVIRISDSSQTYNANDLYLRAESCSKKQSIFAWAPGYEISSIPCQPPYQIQLNPVQAIDNPYYAWSAAATDCINCHANQMRANQTNDSYNSYDEMNEWFRSGHANVFAGRYFESMYRGTTVTGKVSRPAQPVIIGNEWVPVPPELNQDYHGPGFKLDFPQQPGNCAYCHVPALISASQGSVDLSSLFPRPTGALGEGVTCDVCHKVFDITLADNGFPFTDRPGVLSFRFLRPNSGLMTTGPFSNILTAGPALPADHHSTCAPIFSQSEFCAACHFGKFGDTVIYNSYGEWKASSFAANPKDPGYRTCQDCHMSRMRVEDTTPEWLMRQACSAENTSFQNFDHNMMNFGSAGSPIQIPLMIENAAKIDLHFGYQPSVARSFDAMVGVTNTQAGHNFPTDSPLRHLILLVTAVDRVDTPLMQVGGERIPNWAGPRPGSSVNDKLDQGGVKSYSGLPGKIFANLLVEEETNLSPGIAYWNETKPASANSDNRLHPGVPDNSSYSFSIPDSGDVKVTVKLIYRFAFYDLMAEKEWFDRPDIVVATIECQGPPTQPEVLRQSCKQIEP